jgi:hypothetical protein
MSLRLITDLKRLGCPEMVILYMKRLVLQIGDI